MPFLIFIGIFVSIIGLRVWLYYGNQNDLTIHFNPHTKLFKNRLRLDQVNILSRYSRYYRHLPERLKAYYEDRILSFIANKEFITKGTLSLTEEKQLIVADSAIKLTFGLKMFAFEQFEKIILFNGEFYSDFSHSLNKGETNPAGAIVFSWKDLEEGDLKEDDGINLGLHEFAHALMVQNLGPQGYDDEYFVDKISGFEDFYNDSTMLANVKEHHLFRAYAFKNKMEFFAICCEQFFEVPEKMKAGLPRLYELICRMLNQDPLTIFSPEMGSRRTE
jgi:MtfA peptidase